MYELIYEIAVLTNDGIIKVDIKTNDDTIIKDITDIVIDYNTIRVTNKEYGVSNVYLYNIKDIHIVKL